MLAPRGHGKSTVANIFYSLGLVEQNPNIRILIISNTSQQAEMFLGAVSNSLVGLNRKGHKWTRQEIVVNTRTKNAKESTITAMGVRGSVIGRHYDVIICDDIVDNRNSATKAQREKLREWFYVALMPCLEPDGKFHVIGTRWHPDDLYSELMIGGMFRYVLDTAILQNGKDVLWPEKFSLKKLDEIRRRMGTRLFNCQYQNNPQGLIGKLFQPNWFRYYEAEPKGCVRYVACDLAISQKESADYFAIVTVARAEDGSIYVLDAERGKISFAKQLEMIERKYASWKPEVIGIENTAYQDALRQQLLEDAFLPIKGLRPMGSKMTRANALSAQMEFGRVYFRKDMRELVDELLAFPDGAYDDYVDALGYAVALAMESDTGTVSMLDVLEDIRSAPDRITTNQDNEF